jgi:hypothetical protein
MSEHVNYPHNPGRLYDCEACEASCHCTDDGTECVWSGHALEVVDHLEALIPHLEAARARYSVESQTDGALALVLPADDGTYVLTAESDDDGELDCYVLGHYAPGGWESLADPLSITEVFTSRAFGVWLLTGGGLAVLRDWEV